MIKLEVIIDSSKSPWADVRPSAVAPTEEEEAVASICSRALEVAFETVVKHSEAAGTVIVMDDFLKAVTKRLEDEKA
jgi:hypothetical protein